MNIKNKAFFRIIPAALAVLIAVSAAGFSASAVRESAEVIENSAPIAENLELSTYRNVPVSGRLSAMDPEGDELIFLISREPRRGTVELCENGDFTYTPFSDKKGKDSFTFTAVDSCGNISAEATVSLKIKPQTTDICYADMEYSNSAYDAVCLVENGIFIGEKIGGNYFFSPDAAVTRSEFLAMCMSMCGIENISDITKTGFSDDDSIPDWSKPYVATALMAGIVRGYKDETGSVVFSANAPISYSEAVVILDNALNITDIDASDDDYTGVCPTWAYQSAANLASCRIIAEVNAAGSSAVLTRADAAKMLSASLNVLENRSSGRSLFGWLG